MKFEQTALPFLQTIAGQMQSQEQTQQIRLADSLPDVKHIISAWGQVVIRGKQWMTGSVQVSGGIKAWVLYQGEPDDKVQCVETWFPFQMDWDIPAQDRDGCITALPYLRSIDARTLSDRKILVRATVGVLMQATIPAEAIYYKACELPEDVQVLCRTYPMQLPTEQGEKLVNIEETLALPTTNCKVIRCNVIPNVSESRIVSDKLVLRGTVRFDILLMDDNGGISRWQPELHFSQFAQLQKEYDPHAFAEIAFAVTELDAEPRESGEMLLKCSFLAQYTIYDLKTISIVEDAYSTCRSLEMKMHPMTAPALLNDKQQSIQIANSAQQDCRQILDINVLMDDVQIMPKGNKLHISPRGVFQMLYEDAEGNLVSSLSKWESAQDIENDSDTEVQVSVDIDGIPSLMGSNVSQQLVMRIKSISRNPINMVAELMLGDENESDPNRPNLILSVMGEEGLWALSKSTGSTVDAIMKANGLQQEPQPGQLLLIPLS